MENGLGILVDEDRYKVLDSPIAYSESTDISSYVLQHNLNDHYQRGKINSPLDFFTFGLEGRIHFEEEALEESNSGLFGNQVDSYGMQIISEKDLTSPNYDVEISKLLDEFLEED